MISLPAIPSLNFIDPGLAISMFTNVTGVLMNAFDPAGFIGNITDRINMLQEMEARARQKLDAARQIEVQALINNSIADAQNYSAGLNNFGNAASIVSDTSSGLTQITPETINPPSFGGIDVLNTVLSVGRDALSVVSAVATSKDLSLGAAIGADVLSGIVQSTLSGSMIARESMLSDMTGIVAEQATGSWLTSAASTLVDAASIGASAYLTASSCGLLGPAVGMVGGVNLGLLGVDVLQNSLLRNVMNNSAASGNISMFSGAATALSELGLSSATIGSVLTSMEPTHLNTKAATATYMTLVNNFDVGPRPIPMDDPAFVTTAASVCTDAFGCVYGCEADMAARCQLTASIAASLL